MTTPPDAVRHVGLVGAGAMGQGIAQVAATGGFEVTIFDSAGGGAERAFVAVGERIRRLAEKGRIGGAEAETSLSRIAVASDLSDLAACGLVIEAAFEDLGVKRDIFARLEEIVAEDAILASNTSSLLIAAVGRDCRRRDRLAGLHFFNPVPLMKLVEVVRGPDTSQATIDILRTCAERMGRTPIVVADAPGFLVNLGGRAFTTEAMRILHERVARPDDIDAVMRDCCHFRMGPLELADLTGIDVNYPATQLIYEGYDQDPRLKTSFPHRALFEAGRLGRKTGRGVYRYEAGGRRIEPDSTVPVGSDAPCTEVVVPELSARLARFLGEVGPEGAPRRRRSQRDRRCPAGGGLLDLRRPHGLRSSPPRIARSPLRHVAARDGDDAARWRSAGPKTRRCGDPGLGAGRDDHPRFGRLHRPAYPRADREPCLRDGPNRHRVASGHRSRDVPRPELSRRALRPGERTRSCRGARNPDRFAVHHRGRSVSAQSVAEPPRQARPADRSMRLIRIFRAARRVNALAVSRSNRLGVDGRIGRPEP